MPLFRKKPDPLRARAREIDTKIAALEEQIRRLNKSTAVPPVSSPPRYRSTATPHGSPAAGDRPLSPTFEDVGPRRPAMSGGPTNNPAHLHELGVRKYDFLASWRRLLHHLRGPTSNNPKLINHLAAGSIQGLRPLRYEKRIARNRFLFMFGVLLLILWMLVWLMVKH